MRREFPDYSTSEKVGLAVGAVCIVVGVVWLFGSYAGWWHSVSKLMWSLSSFLLPISAVTLGVYLVWGMRNGRFAGLVDGRERMRSDRRFVRSSSETRIAGVCGAIATFCAIDVVSVRIIVLLLFAMVPVPVMVLYALLAIAVPHD